MIFGLEAKTHSINAMRRRRRICILKFLCVECNRFLELAMMPFCAVFVCVCARACMMKKNVPITFYLPSSTDTFSSSLSLSLFHTEREREREKEYRIQWASTKDEGEV